MGELVRQREPSRRAIGAIEAAMAVGDLDLALGTITEQAERFLEWGPEVPLDRLEAWLDALEQHAPDNPWLLYYRAWAWSTQRNHTLALITLSRAAERFAATLKPDSNDLRRSRFLVAMAEGTISDREGLYQPARRAFAEALALAGIDEPPSPTPDEARWLERDPSGFFAFCLQALHLYRATGLALASARVYHNLGTRLVDRGEPLAARTFLEQARELKAGSGNRLAVANTLNSLGHAERHLGLHERATAHLDEALHIAEELNHAWLSSYALNNLAEVNRDSGRFDRAGELYAASIAIKQQTDNVFGLAHSYASLADMHLIARDSAAAVAAAEEAVKLRVPSPDPLEDARLLACRARARLSDGAAPRPICAELESLHETLSDHDAKAEMALAGWWQAVALIRIGDEAGALRRIDATLKLVGTFGLEHFMAPMAGTWDEPLRLAGPSAGTAALVRAISNATALAPLRATTREAGLPVLRVQLFGDLGLTVNGQEVDVAAWRSKKAATLLMLLLHARGRLVHREEAIEALWPESDGDRAGKLLNVAMTAVRRGLEAADPAGGRCIQRIGESYRLAAAVLEHVDVEEFARLASLAERHGRHGELAAAVAAADTALALTDAGDYLAGVPYAEWAAGERERLRESALDLRTNEAEWLLSAGDPQQALRRAAEVLTVERWRERAWRAMISAHHAIGDRTAALQAFTECKQALNEELGVNPSEPLRSLADSLRT